MGVAEKFEAVRRMSYWFSPTSVHLHFGLHDLGRSRNGDWVASPTFFVSVGQLSIHRLIRARVFAFAPPVRLP